MFKVKGKVEFYTSWCIAWVDDEIREYYSSLVPKYFYLQPPAAKAHATIVRKSIEQVQDWSVWNKPYEVDIEYDGLIQYDDVYFWLNCWSKDIGDLREKFGLPRFRAGFDRYHITIGNRKKDFNVNNNQNRSS